jgi:hypothetical protein
MTTSSAATLVLKNIHDNEKDTLIKYKDADGKVHWRFVDNFQMTVKEARELALQEFQIVVKDGDRAVLKFNGWYAASDHLPLLPKEIYLLAFEPSVGKFMVCWRYSA